MLVMLIRGLGKGLGNDRTGSFREGTTTQAIVSYLKTLEVYSISVLFV
ncbi:MAG: hypothetical protein ACOYME_01365 [Prochlorotrichaceae cyanobacterium]